MIRRRERQRQPALRALYALWALLAVLALALILRFFRLDGQSLWADEGTSVALAPRSLIQIARDASLDIHPPLYYFLLHYWVQLLGNTEFAVRSLSALCGTLLVVATYLLGERLFDHRLGLTAAFIAAISPFQIYYSQETRMYILAALLGAVSFLTLLQFMANPKGRRGVVWQTVYVLVTVALLYTHYFAVTLLVAQNLVWIGWLWRGGHWRHRVAWLRWTIGQVTIVAAFVPWLWYARQTLQSWPAISAPFGPRYLLGEVWRVFSLGLSVPATFSPLLLGFALLLVAGVAWSLRFQGRESLASMPWAIVLLYLATPLLLTYLASLRRPAYNPKFLLLATPPYHLLLAAGILGLWEIAPGGRFSMLRPWGTALGLAFILLASVQSLRGYYFDPQYARDDYRALVHYIESVAGPDDAILIDAPGQIEIVDYYAQGTLPEYPLPQHRPPDRAETETALTQLATLHRRLFAILWATDESDPQGIVTAWLAQHTYPASTAWYGNVQLAVYATPKHDRATWHTIGADFGARVRLDRYALHTPTVAAGDVVELSLVWRGLMPLNRRYKVFTHLLDPADHIVAQRDAEPLSGARPTVGWEPGWPITDRYGLPVMAGTPPGNYRLEVGLYDAETGKRLSTTNGDRLVLDNVRVTRPPAPPPLSALPIQHREEGELGILQLRGWNLARLGVDRPLGEPVQAGTPLSLVFFWQRSKGGKATGVPSLHLMLGAVRQPAATWTLQPLDGRYPPTEWLAGELVRDPHTFFLPQGLAPGRYDLRLRAGLPNGQTITYRMGSVVVRPPKDARGQDNVMRLP